MRSDGFAEKARIGGRVPDVYLYAGAFAGAVGAFCLAQVIDHRFGLASDLVAIAGYATCGWSWLLIRALFRPPTARRTRWPLALVVLLVATGAFLRLSGGGSSALPRMIDNLSGLISSALLLLAAIEPLKGLLPGLPRRERLFRIGFVLSYGTMVAVAVVWVNGAPVDTWVGQWKQLIKTACAVAAVLGMGFAVWYRRRHPLVETGRSRPRLPTDESRSLGERLLRLMADEAIYTRQNLKIADLARRLGEAEYKVTQSITGPLTFRNFNHMANHFRIEEAKRRLADSAFDTHSVLTIAFDCGFGSVGPFNRAFKAQTGFTPVQFRKRRAMLETVPTAPNGASGEPKPPANAATPRKSYRLTVA